MLHLRRFIDLVRELDHRNRQELRLTPQQARDLVLDITALMLELERRRQEPDQPAAQEIQAPPW